MSIETPRHQSVVGCAVYVEGKRRSEPVSVDDAGEIAAEVGGFVWLGLHEPSAADFADIAEKYGLHHLAVEDAVNAHQRPKLEPFPPTAGSQLAAHMCRARRPRPTKDRHATGQIQG